MSSATMQSASQSAAQLAAQTTPAEPLVLVRREGAITRITLNRPRAINALSRDMFGLIGEGITAAQADGSTAIVLDGAGDRGFCGGGDIKEISGPHGREILALEYGVDYAIAQSQIPVIGLMDGITMGGGIGLAGHAHHRIVTERSRLAMPETRIGIVPDVGGHRLLARAPRLLGDYLALTAAEMGPGDALALGFADHIVPAADLEALRAALASGEAPAEVCGRFASASADQIAKLAQAEIESPLLAVGAWWGPLAAEALGSDWRAVYADPAPAVLRIVDALEAAGATGTGHARAAADTAAVIREMCPTSLAVTLAQIARTRAFDFTLAEVLTDDLRVCGRMLARPDFAEGVRAQVIDKDRNPAWHPNSLEEIDAQQLASLLAPKLGANEPVLRL